MDNKIKKIGILTSGGDAPGMNASIRAIVRTALKNGIEVVGFMRGYEGLITGDYINLDNKSVSEIMQRGGTILLSARCKEMMTDEGKQKAVDICKKLNLDALFVIGGDGSLTGALHLSKLGIKVMGIPGTIDLDLACSDYTVGFDTAVNTAMEAINKIRDTSSSHERCSIIQVMGRNAGYIALWCGLINGAEEVLIPERPDVTEAEIIELIENNRKNGKISNVIVLAEGFTKVEPHTFAKTIEQYTGIETRATVLGHLQRGGSPTAVDRMHASMMGYKAVEELLKGNVNRIIVLKNGNYVDVDLEEGLNTTRTYDDSLYQIIKTFA
ncbi:6-phosphofructokinase [[Clostridium] colinum]|uniref:6-phosphofructokinase n=1 Tax=[Clostridium] colinum TaxID=36835 RepID=UPI002024439E|nr:6-phosphofructokinase [[Clostridium] colinum]